MTTLQPPTDTERKRHVRYRPCACPVYWTTDGSNVIRLTRSDHWTGTCPDFPDVTDVPFDAPPQTGGAT